MRYVFISILVAGLAAVGCGSDGCSGNGCGGSAGTGGVSGSGGGGSPGNGGTGGEVTEIDLQVEDYILGLERPWDIAWLPNETVLVTERPGTLKVFVDGPDAAPTVIPIDDVESTGGEGGLMGLAVDPAFDENGYIYVCMASNAGAENDVRLVRLTMRLPNADAIGAKCHALDVAVALRVPELTARVPRRSGALAIDT